MYKGEGGGGSGGHTRNDKLRKTPTVVGIISLNRIVF